jgi:hypothetical protein
VRIWLLLCSLVSAEVTACSGPDRLMLGFDTILNADA